MPTENLIVLDSIDPGAVNNALSVAHKFSLDGSESLVLYVGEWYFHDRKALREITCKLPQRVKFSRLNRLERAQPTSWVTQTDRFLLSLKSVATSFFGTSALQAPNSFLKKIHRAAVTRLSLDLLSSIEASGLIEGLSRIALPNGRFPQEAICHAFMESKSVSVHFYHGSNLLRGRVFLDTHGLHDISPYRDWKLTHPTPKNALLARGWLDSRVAGSTRDNHFAARFDDGLTFRGSFDALFFSSSTEEFYSVYPPRKGLDVDQYARFSQIIDKILKVNKSAVLGLRLHPNLLNKRLSQQRDELRKIYALQVRYPQLIVFGPQSPSNSYKLVSNSKLVVVSASTIGLEALYLGKPLIMVSETRFSYLPSVTRVFTDKELDDLSDFKIDVDSASLPAEAVALVAHEIARDNLVQRAWVTEKNLRTERRRYFALAQVVYGLVSAALDIGAMFGRLRFRLFTKKFNFI